MIDDILLYHTERLQKEHGFKQVFVLRDATNSLFTELEGLKDGVSFAILYSKEDDTYDFTEQK